VTVLEVIQRSTDFLRRKGVESPRLQIECLLAHTLGMPRLQLYLNFERLLTPGELESLREMVRRRGTREPLQHIIGSAPFCGIEIKVGPEVLVPRPETEMLAERGWSFLNLPGRDSAEPATALDFGTGSGCIAIALALNAPKARIRAVDVSEAALKTARQNANDNRVADRVEFLRVGGFHECGGAAEWDLIISNPPYIPSGELPGLDPEVRDFDPSLALDGGGDGLQFYRQLAAGAGGCLRAGGKLMIEFGDGQETDLEAIFRQSGWVVEAVEKDLGGRPRILVARRGEA
jgi:release factor glutamine methyltransferase